jgi:hypothetical protein
MLTICSVGGIVFLSHHQNEAVNGNSLGLHQYNFDVSYCCFVIWNKEMHVYVDEFLGEGTTVEAKLSDSFVQVVIRKGSAAVPNAELCRDRLRFVLDGFVNGLCISKARAIGVISAETACS